MTGTDALMLDGMPETPPAWQRPEQRGGGGREGLEAHALAALEVAEGELRRAVGEGGHEHEDDRQRRAVVADQG